MKDTLGVFSGVSGYKHSYRQVSKFIIILTTRTIGVLAGKHFEKGKIQDQKGKIQKKRGSIWEKTISTFSPPTPGKEIQISP